MSDWFCFLSVQRSPSASKDPRRSILFNAANSAFWKRLAHLLNVERSGESRNVYYTRCSDDIVLRTEPSRHVEGISSGSTLACSARGPGIESALQTKVSAFTKVTVIRSFGHGLHTYCSA